MKPKDLGRGSKPGAGDLRVHHSHPASWAPWPRRWALAWRAGFLFPEAEGDGGGSCSRHQLGSPRLEGFGAGKWMGCKRIGVQVSVPGGLCERTSPDGSPCLHVSASWFPFLLVLVLRSFLALEGCRLPETAGPASALRRQAIPLQPGSAPLPRALHAALALLSQPCAGSRARAPPSSQRGSRALQSRFSCGGRL